jgi:hypothetical protein
MIRPTPNPPPIELPWDKEDRMSDAPERIWVDDERLARMKNPQSN